MIYICIPTHDEERTIGVMLWKIRQVMAEFQRDYQILVADDASTDATREILAPYTRILPLTILRSDERLGYAASLERLLREAVARSSYPRRDAILTLQADFTEEPEEIPALIKRIEGGADVVTSEVRSGMEQAPRPVRWLRRLLLFLLRRVEWPEVVSDPLSGFRAYRLMTIRKALEARGEKPLLEWDGWAANAALLHAVVPFARRVEEVSVSVRYDRRRRATRFRPLEAGRQLLRFVRNGNGANGSMQPVPEARSARGSDQGTEEGNGQAPRARSRGAAGGAGRGGAAGNRRGRPRKVRSAGGRRSGPEQVDSESSEEKG